MKYVLLFVFCLGINVSAWAQDGEPVGVENQGKVAHGTSPISASGISYADTMFRLEAKFANGRFVENIVFRKQLSKYSNHNWGLELDGNVKLSMSSRRKFIPISEEEFVSLLSDLLDTAESKDLTLEYIAINMWLIEPLWADISSSVRRVAQEKTGTIKIKENELKAAFDEVIATSSVLKSSCDLIAGKDYECGMIGTAHTFRHKYRDKPWSAILKDDHVGLQGSSKFGFELVRK